MDGTQRPDRGRNRVLLEYNRGSSSRRLWQRPIRSRGDCMTTLPDRPMIETEHRIPEIVDGLPNICGSEHLVAEAMARRGPYYFPESGIDFERVRNLFGIALHMHQPLIPAGGPDLRTAAVISNLKYMMDNQQIGDNHNAPVFHWCYKRMGEFIPQLVQEGKKPRVMLDYSGCLLYGLRAMGLNDVFDNLQ